jgi:hypothetical protein
MAEQVSKQRHYGTMEAYQCRICNEWHLFTRKEPKPKEEPIAVNRGGLNFIAHPNDGCWRWQIKFALPNMEPIRGRCCGEFAKWDCLVEAMEQAGQITDDRVGAAEWITHAKEYIQRQREID